MTKFQKLVQEKKKKWLKLLREELQKKETKAKEKKTKTKLIGRIKNYSEYEIIKEDTILVDKTGKGHYVEVAGLDYTDYWENGIQGLSQKNSKHYYQMRKREYLKRKGERKYRIVTDVVELIYHHGERIK